MWMALKECVYDVWNRQARSRRVEESRRRLFRFSIASSTERKVIIWFHSPIYVIRTLVFMYIYTFADSRSVLYRYAASWLIVWNDRMSFSLYLRPPRLAPYSKLFLRVNIDLIFSRVIWILLLRVFTLCAHRLEENCHAVKFDILIAWQQNSPFQPPASFVHVTANRWICRIMTTVSGSPLSISAVDYRYYLKNKETLFSTTRKGIHKLLFRNVSVVFNVYCFFVFVHRSN